MNELSTKKPEPVFGRHLPSPEDALPMDRALRATALRRLKAAGLAASRVAVYERVFDKAHTSQGASDPIPCPDCFMRKAISGLEATHAPEGYTALKCSGCGSVIVYPNDGEAGESAET